LPLRHGCRELETTQLLWQQQQEQEEAKGNGINRYVVEVAEIDDGVV
jgi:hypothetical protein